MTTLLVRRRSESRGGFDLHVRGEIPAALEGTFLLATSRRIKDRSVFSRWHDSHSDLLRLDVRSGSPGRISGRFLDTGNGRPVALADGVPAAHSPPNHAVNVEGRMAWATNLLFGAPLEIDLAEFRVTRSLRVLETDRDAPRLSSTSHFAWDRDRRRAYFHQSRLVAGRNGCRAESLSLVELDASTGRLHRWDLMPPADDADPADANFHSAFYYEDGGQPWVGLLRTGARATHPEPGSRPTGHRLPAMRSSTVWVVRVDHDKTKLQASLLPDISNQNAIALSHLCVEASDGDGFVLWANAKQAAVGAETHGVNVYGERPGDVQEHYSGMVVEPFGVGCVMRIEHRRGRTAVKCLRQPYHPEDTAKGHTWLPINLARSTDGRRLFGSFAGFRPRLLPRHIAAVHKDRTADPRSIRYVPPLLMQMDPDSLRPVVDDRRRISYAESVAFCVVGDRGRDWLCTYGSEAGFRVYEAGDFSRMVAHATAPQLAAHADTHFRPDPPHIEFVPRS